MSADRDLLRDDRGQTIVLVAVALPMLLALILFVIDGGRLYVERERLHGAAQLAAEAGWSAVPDLKLKPSELTDLQRVRSGVDPVVREALERNLEQPCASDGSQPCRYTLEVVPGSDPDRLGVKVRVTRPFLATVQAVRFVIGAEGTAGTSLARSSAPAQQQAVAPAQGTSFVPPRRISFTPRPGPAALAMVRQPVVPPRRPTLFRPPTRSTTTAPAPVARPQPQPVARPRSQPVVRQAVTPPPVVRRPTRTVFGRFARPVAPSRSPAVAPAPGQVVRPAPAPVIAPRPVFGAPTIRIRRLKSFASVL